MDDLIFTRHTQDGRIQATHIAIIGGGASGTLMAVHLLMQAGADLFVTLIETSGALGRGVAYASSDPDHLLNTRVHNMSALPDDPLHFLHWLRRQPQGHKASELSFVSRGTYGSYLTELLDERAGKGFAARLSLVRQTCTSVEETGEGVALTLADGSRIIADHAILATGHVQPDRSAEWLLNGSWDALDRVPSAARVVIIGSGLSMVDQVLTLLRGGHRGPILSISRRGLLPRDHTASRPLQVDAATLPLGQPMSQVLRWARGQARLATAKGGTWRDAVDGIRPHLRAIWRSLPLAERSRFLRHGARWWDVHRHRIPPQTQTILLDAIRRGQLTVAKGAYTGASERLGGGLFAHHRPFGQTEPVACSAARIVDCRGIRRDPELNASALVADLLARGAARVDPLRIGLDVDEQGRLIRRDGELSNRVWAIGPASRAAFWEITAIPDIREQVVALAARLAAQSAPAEQPPIAPAEPGFFPGLAV